MSAAITPELYADLVSTAAHPGFDEWRAMVRATGGCAEPVHLLGESWTIHAGSGELLARREPGRLLVACGNRRSSRCRSCSETYRADTFQLVRAGLVGGKGVSESVAGHPKVFATFTAPSFGPVHHRVTTEAGAVQPCHPHEPLRCGRRHTVDDPVLGEPLDPESYDYVGAVIWNALSTRLWARTVCLVNRQAARMLGVSQRHWPGIGRVSVAKVAEFQARGVVHFHAIFRLDGPDTGDPPPEGASVDLLCEAIRRAALATEVNPPESASIGELGTICWGKQLDVRPITGEASDGRSLSDGQVAGYLAKYATKGAETSGTVDRPLACRRCKGTGREHEGDRGMRCDVCRGNGARERLAFLGLPAHAKAMVTTCWQLGGLSELAALRLRPWAHMLGFRGHFSTKTRRYSTTLGCLRGARRRWQTTRTLVSHGLDPATTVERHNIKELDNTGLLEQLGNTVLVVGHWRYIGRGHSPGQAVYASTIANDLTLARQLRRQASTESALRGSTAGWG
jgi:hypothetical protein